MEIFLHKFGIDVRLIIAQAVNFGVLFFLLYRFAYRPILRMLEERRVRIADGMKMREDSEKRLEEAEREHTIIVEKAEVRSLEIINRGEEQGKVREAEILSFAQKKGEAIIAETRARAEQEKRRAAAEFSKQSAELVRMAAAKAIAGSPEQIDEELVKRALAAFDGAQKNFS